jgi:hypothetical protein
MFCSHLNEELDDRSFAHASRTRRGAAFDLENNSKSSILYVLCYGAETLRGNFLRFTESLRLLIVFFSGSFWYTQQLYFNSRFRLYISRGTDTIMTQYDTGRTEIPFGPFDVCIWVSHFLVQDSRIEDTPHQRPLCGIFAEPLN